MNQNPEKTEDKEKHSLFRWANTGINNSAERQAQEAVSQNISVEELRQQEGAQRAANIPSAVQPESQDAINQSLDEVAEKEHDLEENQYRDIIDEEIHDPEERALVRQELNERYSVEPTEEEREAEAAFYAEQMRPRLRPCYACSILYYYLQNS